MVDWQPGDILACYGRTPLSWAIRLATLGPSSHPALWLGPSHVAMIALDHDLPWWIESTQLCSRPCRLQQRVSRGAQAHAPGDRLDDCRTDRTRVDHWRLTPLAAFSAEESRLLTRLLLTEFVIPGVRYDTCGAVISACRTLKLSRCLPPAGMQAVFCSELLAAVLMRLGRLNWTNPTTYHPAGLLRVLHRTGVYRRHERLCA
jgi:hypothetical protein